MTGPLFTMALRNLAEEWTVSLAVCLAIAAVASPILVLLALYSGVISDIFSGLRADPGAREIRLAATGASRFDEAWFAAVAAWPEVAFVAPSTRYASTQGQAFDATGAQEARASLIPTGPGDPAFPPNGLALSGPGEAGLSHGLAERLGVEPGGAVMLEVTRSGVDSAGIEAVIFPLRAIRRAAAADFGRDALFVSPALLAEIEDFKNGFRAPLLGVDGAAPPPREHHPDFRLYAVDVAEVAALTRRLEAAPHSLTLRTAASRIGFATQLDRSLSLVIAAIGGLGLVGLAGGLIAIQWSMAARRRRTIAVLSLIGFPRRALVAFPVIQALLLAAAGAALTVAFAWLFCNLIDRVMTSEMGLAPTDLRWSAATAVTGVIFAVSLAPALWIGLAHSKLSPSDEIRET